MSSQFYWHFGKYLDTQRQKNINYSIFKALKFNMVGIEAALICYDVMCQWSIHMKDRVAGSRYLNISDGLELRLGIGLFHIHGHQDSCLARYLPSFIEGSQQIDGEIIETLWALLNEISRNTRGMFTSHHREVIDNHMNNSNWKKLVNLSGFPLIGSTGTSHQSSQIMQSMLYLNATRRLLHADFAYCADRWIPCGVIIYTVTSTSPWHGLSALELLIRSQLRLRVYSVIESPKYFKEKLTRYCS